VVNLKTSHGRVSTRSYSEIYLTNLPLQSALRQCAISSTGEKRLCFYVCLSVCLFVCLLWTDFDKTFCFWRMERDPRKNWWRRGSRSADADHDPRIQEFVKGFFIYYCESSDSQKQNTRTQVWTLSVLSSSGFWFCAKQSHDVTARRLNCRVSTVTAELTVRRNGPPVVRVDVVGLSLLAVICSSLDVRVQNAYRRWKATSPWQRWCGCCNCNLYSYFYARHHL